MIGKIYNIELKIKNMKWREIYKVVEIWNEIHLGLADKLLIKNFTECTNKIFYSHEVLKKFGYKSKGISELIKLEKDYEIRTVNYYKAGIM